jgi:catechol 2,3-dioxygenase-like lactoylglutathione lyase family enzyme
VGDVYGNIPQFPRAGAIERNVRQFTRLSREIPADVALGYHLCFGTLGGWPRFSPPDLGEAVNLANALIETAPRRVDWVHIPVLDRSDDAFFAPLAKLQPRGTRIYLGVIHNMARFPERVAAAHKYLPDFGVAAYCGLGRSPPSEVPTILAEHRKAVEAA